MVTDCAMLEVSSAGVEDEGDNGDNEVELSLELSIGRSYKRSKPEHKKSTDSCTKMGGVDRSFSRSGVSEKIFAGETGSEGAMDLQSKREIQALRRQEARKKREEKLKKLAHCKGFVNGGNEMAWLEARQFEARVRERERENEEANPKPSRKREKIENVGQNCFGNEGIRDLNLALNTRSCSMASAGVSSSVPLVPMQLLGRPFRSGGMHPDVRPCRTTVAGDVNRSEEKPSVRADSRSFRPYHGILNTAHDDGTDNGSAGCSSSAVSDYQSSPRQGGGRSSSDSGRSNSSHSTKPKQPQQNLINASAATPTQHSEHTTSSSSSAPLIKPNEPVPVPVPVSKDPKQHMEAANPCKPQTENTNETLVLPQMPCVSATGNGPNGKTINGLLYRYSKTEVTIVCVCHGTSFSPDGFVEHAGGVDIAHPLKHITVVPSAF